MNDNTLILQKTLRDLASLQQNLSLLPSECIVPSTALKINTSRNEGMKTSFLKGHLNKYQMRGKQIKKLS